MSFIFSFLIFVLFLGLFIILAVFGFLRSLFSFGKQKKTTRDSQSQDFQQTTSKPKVFDKKEGEYVDYEEVE